MSLECVLLTLDRLKRSLGNVSSDSADRLSVQLLNETFDLVDAFQGVTLSRQQRRGLARCARPDAAAAVGHQRAVPTGPREATAICCSRLWLFQSKQSSVPPILVVLHSMLQGAG